MRRLTSLLSGTALLLLPVALPAQGRELEVRIGPWYEGSGAHAYELRTSTQLTGPIDQVLAGTVLINDSLGRRRAFYGAGYELQAFPRRAALSPYVLAGAALGLSTDTSTQALGLLWSVGWGLEWRPVSWFAAGGEMRYLLDDRGPRGFWRSSANSRSGIALGAGVSIGFGRRDRSRSERAAPRPAPYAVPPGGAGLPTTTGSVSGTAGDVVETALDVLGTPYQWGGTADNGFDCSGLIQYAYGQHGIRVPRRSREQAQAGAEVTPVVEALRPGDILLFSVRSGAGVTHVGLYISDGKFIHSATNGVKMSRLDPHDPDGAYWLNHWVGVRRLIP